MSKYRSAAQPGSFGAGQLKTNDKKQRDILNTMNDTVQQMESNKSLLREQQELYLRAQQFNQGEEQKVREMNFDTESESRQRYKDSITQNYKIQLQNNEAESNSRLDVINEIGAWSKTAKKLGVDMINDRITKRRQAYSAVVMRTGLTGRELRDVQALDDNLTQSAFMQSQAILDLKARGVSDEDINAIYNNAYKDSGSLAWVDNKAVLRNSENGFKLALEKWDVDNPTASGKEREIGYNTVFDTFASGLGDGSGRQFTAEMLETTIGGTYRTLLTNKLMQATAQQTKENLADIELKQGQAFDNIYRGTGGANGLMQSLKDNSNSRKALVKYLSNSLKSDQMSPDEVNDILNSKLQGYEGGDKTFRQAFGLTDEVVALLQDMQTKDNNNRTKARQRQANAIEDANNEILRRGNAALADNRLDDAEFQEIYAFGEGTGLDMSKLTALARVKKESFSAKRVVAIEAEIQRLIDNDDWNLETRSNLDIPSALDNKYKSLAIAGSKLKTDPKVKVYKQTFKDMIANNPTIIGFKQEKSPGVGFMVNKYVEEFNKETQVQLASMANQGLPQDFDAAAQSASLTIQRKITEAMNDPTTLIRGEFKEYINSFTGVSEEEVERLSLRNKINTAVLTNKWGEVYKSVNKEEFIEFAQQNQGQVNPVAELIAATMNSGLTAEQVHNKIAANFGGEPLATTSQTMQDIESRIPETLRRFQIFDRIPDRIFAHQNGASTSPVRSTFDTGNYSNDPPSEGAMSRQQMVDLAVSAGFTPEEAYTVSQIGMGESGWDPTNSTERSGLRARTGEDSVGLMQINWGYHKDRGWLQKLGINKREDLFNPVLNMKAAKFLYDQARNFNDWTVYTSGDYLNH
jgi:hypothetical protein